MRVLGIAGSLRADSHNGKLLALAAGRLPADARFERFQRLRDVPAFNQDLEHDPPAQAVAELRAAIDAADAVIVATPEYNASFPGALKNALDWASRPFEENVLRGKPVAVVGASTGRFGAVEAQSDLRKVLARIGARVVQLDLPVAKADEVFDGTAAVRLPEPLDVRLDELLAELLDEAAANAQALAA